MDSYQTAPYVLQAATYCSVVPQPSYQHQENYQMQYPPQVFWQSMDIHLGPLDQMQRMGNCQIQQNPQAFWPMSSSACEPRQENYLYHVPHQITQPIVAPFQASARNLQVENYQPQHIQASAPQIVYQAQQLSVPQLIAEFPFVQYPIVRQLQTNSCQPVMQQSESIIYQQGIENNWDEKFESEVLASEVGKELGVDDPKNSEDGLEQDQREALERAVEEYRLACLKTFSITKEGDVIQIRNFPKPEEFTVKEQYREIHADIDQGKDKVEYSEKLAEVGENLLRVNMVKTGSQDEELYSELLTLLESQETMADKTEIQLSVDNFESGKQYKEGHNSGEIHKEKILANYKDREKQASEIGNSIIYKPRYGPIELTELHGRMADILFFQPLKEIEVAVGQMEIEEARYQMVSWNNYCLLSKNIFQKCWLLGVYFPWKPGDQGPKLIILKYQLHGDYFSWKQSGKLVGNLALRELPSMVIWDPGGWSCECIFDLN